MKTILNSFSIAQHKQTKSCTHGNKKIFCSSFDSTHLSFRSNKYVTLQGSSHDTNMFGSAHTDIKNVSTYINKQCPWKNLFSSLSGEKYMYNRDGFP